MRYPLLLATLALAACAAPQRPPFNWMPVDGRANPTLMFGLPDSDAVAFRLECDSAGTRLATFVAGRPRGVAAKDTSFETRMRLFLGRTEVDLGATGTALDQDLSMVEALLPDPNSFFAALAQQGRLVAVTFAGRTKAPAPDADLVAGFRARCPSAG